MTLRSLKIVFFSFRALHSFIITFWWLFGCSNFIYFRFKIHTQQRERETYYIRCFQMISFGIRSQFWQMQRSIGNGLGFNTEKWMKTKLKYIFEMATNMPNVNGLQPYKWKKKKQQNERESKWKLKFNFSSSILFGVSFSNCNDIEWIWCDMMRNWIQHSTPTEFHRNNAVTHHCSFNSIRRTFLIYCLIIRGAKRWK